MSWPRRGAPLAAVAVAAVVARLIVDWVRPPLLIVGPVTVDDVNGNRTVGGAATYAAAVAKAYGTRACAVISAGPDADLSVFDDHNLVVVSSNATLTFEHTYTFWGNQRKLRVLSTTGKSLGLQHVPWHCLLSRVVLLAPLIPEDLHAAEFVKLSGIVQWLLPQHIGLMAQGFQRGTGSKGEVVAFEQPSAQLRDGLGPGVSVFLSDVETDSWQKDTLASVVNRSDRLLVTRGGDGATEYSRGDVKHIPVQKVEVLEDTNGAGDTFATAYMLALARRLADPGAEAARAAARTVMRPQVCKPWCIGEDIDLPLSPVKEVGGRGSAITSLFQGMSSSVFVRAGAVRDFLRAQGRNRDCMG